LVINTGSPTLWQSSDIAPVFFKSLIGIIDGIKFNPFSWPYYAIIISAGKLPFGKGAQSSFGIAGNRWNCRCTSGRKVRLLGTLFPTSMIKSLPCISHIHDVAAVAAQKRPAFGLSPVLLMPSIE
jgi:hypothetical protein